MMRESLISNDLHSKDVKMPPMMIVQLYLRCEEKMLFFTFTAFCFELQTLLIQAPF